MATLIYAISTRGLSFSFSKGQNIVQDVDLRIPAGAAFGILGPNGAGKSTLLKLLLGLLRPDTGRVEILGESPAPGSPVFRRVAALIEEPRLYPHLSGRDNLKVFATYRRLPERRIDQVLEIVGLTQHAGRRVGKYSTGMRQRLGMALALLPDPDVLLLDEPTNGLDPPGIADLRRLILQLHREEGKTVVLSSHLLSEVEQICTHVGILHEGYLRFQGTFQELRQRGTATGGLYVETDNDAQAADVLRSFGYPVEWAPDAGLQVMIRQRSEISDIVDHLRCARLAIFQVRPIDDRLEDYFMRILRGEG